MNSLTKQAKEAIFAQMEDRGEITAEEVKDLIRPYYIFDPHRAREREIGKKANQLMAQFRDERGIRTCYNYKDVDGQSVYVNVDETKDLNALKNVKKQLNSKYDGLNKAKQKVTRRQRELVNQLSLFNLDVKEAR
jgi:hypothetical protein